MNLRCRQLANHVTRAITGPMWHGPALSDVLSGVSHDLAAAHPIAGAHSIWEIVRHITAWAEIARARVRGERTEDAPTDVDWPPVGPANADTWSSAVERMNESYRVLAQDVRQLDDPTLDTKPPGLDYSVSVLLHGVIEHGAYHGGQIALLKRALTSTAS